MNREGGNVGVTYSIREIHPHSDDFGSKDLLVQSKSRWYLVVVWGKCQLDLYSILRSQSVVKILNTDNIELSLLIISPKTTNLQIYLHYKTAD